MRGLPTWMDLAGSGRGDRYRIGAGEEGEMTKGGAPLVSGENSAAHGLLKSPVQLIAFGTRHPESKKSQRLS